MKELEGRVIEGAPDPADAQRRFERILTSAQFCEIRLDPGDPAQLTVLRLACQRAPYLATLLARDPARLHRVAGDPYLHRAKSQERMEEELAELLGDVEDKEALDGGLRRYRGDEILRLGLREIELGTPLEVGEELSNLAGACLNLAIDFHDRALSERYGAPEFVDLDGTRRRAEMVVIGMGKLGGEELNFSSDVDLIYVYDSDEGQAGELSLHEYFSKLCKLLGSSIGDMGAQDCVFKVDLRLRPEGSRGTIANSLASLEAYYESFGRPWERQAWLKARPCAGSERLGNEVMKTMLPFIYPRTMGADVIEQVRELNQRIKSELSGGIVDSGFDLKNGVGGIREVEFFVQALQLIHGGHRPKLRTRSTMSALDELLFSGLVSEEERRSLALAYRYLRHLEHMIQLESGRQTQRLPTEPEALELLAKRTGHRDARELRDMLVRHTAHVAQSFATLGEDVEVVMPQVRALLEANRSDEEELECLDQLGFRDPKASWQLLNKCRQRAQSPFATSATGPAAKVAPALLTEISRSPDPDQALMHAVALMERRGSWSAIWGMMAQNPELLRLIASLFGTSAYLSKFFVAHPELLDQLLISGLAKASLTRRELDKELATLAIDEIEDRETQWNTLAEFKNSQVLRIGLADIAGALDPEEVCGQLSDVAECCVQQALRLVEGDLRERHGEALDESGKPISLAVMALGKMGGRELGYASDLDLVFIYSADGESDGMRPLDGVTYMSRIAQRLMRGLHSLHPGGRLYEVDTRLRPSGSQGLLLSSLSAWRRYHEESALHWEKQALTKLRFIAGDAALGDEVMQAAESFVYGQSGLSTEERRAQTALEVSTMRDRIWQELVKPQKRVDLKAGRGGIIDVEFCAQFLQLSYGAEHPELRSPSTTAVLRRAEELKLAPAALCHLLSEGYRFLRRVEHRLRMVHDRSEHHLPVDPSELDKLARRLGYLDAPKLQEDFGRWTREVHRAYREILGLSPST